jgi:urea carboxylase
MIYPTPRFFPGGDRAIEVELGDGMDFTLNFLVHSLTAAIRAESIRGVVELIPELASLQVSYDPDVISYADLTKEIGRLHGAIGGTADGELPSRLFYVPVLYFDPLTQACVDDYCAKVTPKTADPDLVCELNQISDRASLKRLHSSTEYWVAALGFWPGLCSLMPLDDRARLIAPKYNPPRTWTPKGAIGLGGSLTCIYPDRTPGGYQLLGHTPMPIFDREQRLRAFRDSLALFRPGDRVRFVPIDAEEHKWITAKVDEGTYEHPNVDYQTFSVSRYKDWKQTCALPETREVTA